MRVQVVGVTRFIPPDGVDWSTDAVGGQALAEFAGRACYQSWNKPNPATATNAGYLNHILQVGHHSVLEHGVVTVYITGVSRSLTHELIRHRHFSYSQLSQRYVSDNAQAIEPEVIAADDELSRVFRHAVTTAQVAYAEIAAALLKRGTDATTPAGHTPADVAETTTGQPGTVCQRCLFAWPCPPVAAARTQARKLARQAARAVLPNATETRIVVTGNYRAWRHFLDLRGTEHADVEIRGLAVDCLRALWPVAPNVFGDYRIVDWHDGSQIITRPDAGG